MHAPKQPKILLLLGRNVSCEQISQTSQWSDAEGGINSFIDQQKQEPGEARLTLVQFDTDYEFVNTGKPFKQVPAFKLVAGGSAALLDAVGHAIHERGARV